MPDTYIISANMLKTIIISLPMFVCAFMALLVALSWVEERRKDKLWLLIFMIVSMLLYAGHFVFFHRMYGFLPVTDSIYSFCNPAVYPLYFIYISALTDRGCHARRYLTILLPAIVCSALVGSLYAAMTPEEQTLFITCYLYHNDCASLTGIAYWQAMAHGLVRVVFAVQILPVVIIGFRKIKRFNRLIRANYADTEDKTLTPITVLLYLFLITSVASFVSNAVGRHHFADSALLLAIPSVSFSALLFSIGYIGYRHRFSIIDMEDELQADTTAPPFAPIGAVPECPKQKGSTQHDNICKLKDDIIRIVKEEQIFLTPNLKISDLAAHLNTNRNYIYQAINVEMGISFSEFINTQRTEYAQQLLETHPKMSLEEIALKSGFASRVSFYRSFKQLKGRSPKSMAPTHQLDKPAGI